MQEGILNTINVSFINTHAGFYGGSLWGFGRIYHSTNDRFIDNSADERGSALYGYYSKMYITMEHLQAKSL